MYNHSLFSADRSTHLKVVLVPVVMVALLAAATLNLRQGEAGLRPEGSSIVRAAHSPVAYADSTVIAVR